LDGFLMRAAKIVVPVPTLAESLSEGTVKQLNKRTYFPSNERVIRVEVGEYVEQDEEITSIETDKVRFTIFWMLIGRLTSPSMHLQQGPSRNGLFPRKTMSKLDRNSVKSTPRARPQEEAKNPPRVSILQNSDFRI
jgi:hypothetical protein